MPTRSLNFFHSTVKPTVEEFLKQENDIRRGRLAAIVLYHMADYWYAENKSSYTDLSDLHKNLIRECPDFLLIRDIADASKHAELGTQKKIPRQLSSSEQVTSLPGLFEAPFGEGYFAEAITVFARMDNGEEKPITLAIDTVTKMWEHKISNSQIM
jgi:hypothetical protein